MPLIYRCSSCGAKIVVVTTREWKKRRMSRLGYVKYTREAKTVIVVAGEPREDLRWLGTPTPEELSRLLGGRCPFCGKPLSLKPLGVSIRVARGGSNGAQA